MLSVFVIIVSDANQQIDRVAEMLNELNDVRRRIVFEYV